MNKINFNTFLYGKDYPIINIKDGENIEFTLKSLVKVVKCPQCNHNCHTTHEKHKRVIQDTPIHNKSVFINIDVKEFICKNNECKVKTFTEDLPFAHKNQVRTNALTNFILLHAIYLSSSCTSLIMSFLGVNVSADTVDNIIKNVKIEDNPDVEMIGIDDVSTRKGLKYATAIYDLSDHHLIALLNGREKDDIVPWLKKHPKIIVVARDRASAYAEAVSEVFPDAIQVADRFHLFDNLIAYLKDLFYSQVPDKIVVKNNEVTDKKAKKVLAELVNINDEKLNTYEYDNTEPLDKDGNVIDFIKLEYDLNDELHTKQAKSRVEKYNKIKSLRKDNNLSLAELQVKYGYSKLTIKKYLYLSDEEVEKIKLKRTNKTKKITEFSKYKNIAYKMLLDNVPFEYIIAYILKLGYSKSDISLRNKILCLANNNGFDLDIEFKRYSKYLYKKDELIITRSELLKHALTLDKKKMNKKITACENSIIQKIPIYKKVKEIFNNFHYAIFSKDSDMINIFIEVYKDDIPSFCNGLKKDIAAIKNAISDEINSGFVEGNNNKFKLIKRIVYGKQKLYNLFKRSFLAFASTLDDLTLLNIAVESASH